MSALPLLTAWCSAVEPFLAALQHATRSKVECTGVRCRAHCECSKALGKGQALIAHPDSGARAQQLLHDH